MYAAVRAAVSGSTVDKNEQEAADDIMGLILSGLKSRGMHNYQLGFRDQGDPDALNAMSNDDLIKRCKMLCGYDDMSSAASMHDVKTAEMYRETEVKDGPAKPDAMMQKDAIELLNSRESMGKVPKIYLDDAVNEVGPQTRVVNGTNEFVVAVKNLVGDQTRLRQVHAAQEYLGLKLKAIEEAMRNLTAVRAAEAERADKAVTPNGVG
jgi:hypothetical protein